jgi:hypothetical protein
MKNEIIIECGVDGGAWVLVGSRGADGWLFRASRDEGTLLDFMTEDDAADFEPRHETEWVGSWETALALFDKYPWHTFCTVRVHPDFAGEIWAALQDRWDADERRDEWWMRHTEESWLVLCQGGDHGDFE